MDWCWRAQLLFESRICRAPVWPHVLETQSASPSSRSTTSYEGWLVRPGPPWLSEFPNSSHLALCDLGDGLPVLDLRSARSPSVVRSP